MADMSEAKQYINKGSYTVAQGKGKRPNLFRDLSNYSDGYQGIDWNNKSDDYGLETKDTQLELSLTYD